MHDRHRRLAGSCDASTPITRSPRSSDRIVGLGRLAAFASHKPLEGVKVRPPATLDKELGCIHGCQFLSDSGRGELLTLIPSCFARRSTSALTERGRQSG